MQFLLHKVVPFIVIVGLLLPGAALAQSEPQKPGLPSGWQFLFLPTVMGNPAPEPPPRPFTPPVPVLVTSGQAEAALANSTFCGEFLQPKLSAASFSGKQCLPGSTYVGVSDQTDTVVGAGWSSDNKPVGFVGENAGHQVYNLNIKNASLLLSGNVGLTGQRFDFTDSNVVLFKLNISSPTTMQTASTNGIAYNPLELIARILRINEEITGWHPIAMPYYLKIYRESMFDGLSIAESGCMKYLDWEGKTSWPWYVSPLESRAQPNGELRVAGFWGPPTNPLQLEGVATCMKDRRYMLFQDLFLNEGFSYWRDGIMNDRNLDTRDVQTFFVPQMTDNQYGGTWVISMAAVGSGILIYGQYILNGAVVATTGLFAIFPAWAVECIMSGEPDLEACRVKSVAVSSAQIETK